MSIYGVEIPKSKKAIVQEAYFGKAKELLEIESLIDVVRKKEMSKPYFNVYTGEFPLCNEIIKIDRLFEKLFNFSGFGLIIIPSSHINAMTCPVGAKVDVALTEVDKVRKYTIVDRQGMKFANNNNLCVLSYIYSGLFFHPDITAGEVLAIILHEIGHNFADALNPAIGLNHSMLLAYNIGLSIYYCYCGAWEQAAGMMIGQGMNSNYMSQLITNTMKNIVDNKDIWSINYFNQSQLFFGIMQDLLTLVGKVRFIITLPVSLYRKLIQQVFSMVFHFSGYSDEKTADEFATMYGYGPELSSALTKMDMEPRNAIERYVNDNCPVIGSIAKLPMDLLFTIFSLLDVHPPTGARVENQLENLKYELKRDKSLDPKVKKEIEGQIKSIEKLKKETFEKKSKIPTENMYWFRRIWFEIFSGNNDTINDRFNDNLNASIDKLRVQETSDMMMKRRYEVF